VDHEWTKKWTLPQSGRSLNLGLARKFDPLFHEALECCFNSHRPVQLITGQTETECQFGRLSFFKIAAYRGSWRKLFSRGSTFVSIRPGLRWT